MLEYLYQEGIAGKVVLYPAVPDNEFRVRFVITSEHGDAQIENAVDAVDAIARLPKSSDQVLENN
jgi:7-keto-8-aminopelargonate synthetase-like enzyme